MTFKSVFRSLQEVFPEMDVRILKAVAIEHSKDADAAVEFILSDVLPIISATEPSYTPDISHKTESSIVGGQISCEAISGTSYAGPSYSPKASGEDSHEVMNKINFSPSGNEVAEQNKSLFHPEFDQVMNFWPSDHEVAEQNKNLFHSENDLLTENKSNATSNTQFDDFDAFVSGLCASDHVSIIEQAKAVTSESNQTSQLITDECESRDANVKDILNKILEGSLGGNSNYVSALPSLYKINVNLEKSGAEIENGVKSYKDTLDDLGSFKNVSNIQEICSIEANNPISVLTAFHRITSASEFNSDSIRPQAEESTDTKTPSLSHDEKGPNFMDDLQFLPFENEAAASNDNTHINTKALVQDELQLLPFEDETAATDENTHVNVIAPQSSQMTEVDLLNSYTNEAINTKETLVAALNSATDMLKEVEIHEERAKQAKEVATSAGQDILIKVEDLRQIIKNEKEKIEKSAGEIYGEKSILAAETRELQSRLVSISNDRDKFLSLIQKIHQTLEARLAAAEKERVQAEQEKLEKEESALKALDEQEAIMNSIVQESQRLQQEAEENSKLRNFLEDRGRIIDTLQGELAVICEDVMSIKKRTEGSVQIEKLASSAAVSLALMSPLYQPGATSNGKITMLSESAHHAPMIENTEQANEVPQQQNPETFKSDSDDEWEIFHM